MYEVSVVEKLIDIEKKIFKSFIKLCCYRKNYNLFCKEISFLSDVLLKKEDILISKLPVNEVDLNNILDDIFKNKGNFFDSQCVYYFVFKRISSIISLLIISLDDDVYTDDEYEIVDSLMIRRQIDDNLSAQLLYSISNIFDDDISLKDMFEITKYYEVFTSKKLSDKFVSSGFDFEGIGFLKDSKLCHKLNMDDDDYYSVKDDEIFNSLEDLTSDLLDVFIDGDESYVLTYMLLRFKFLIHNISDSGLSLFDKYFCDAIRSVSDDEIIQGFIYALDFELKGRGINDTSFDNTIIDEDNLSYLVDFIKTEGKIYELYSLIDFDNIDDNILSSLRFFVFYERDLINRIKIDESNESIIRSMFGEDLTFFLSFSKEELSLISKRIFNTIPYFREKHVSPTQSFLSYDYIRENHVIRSLMKFVSIMNDSKGEYFNFFKNVIFVNDFLTFDFMTTGNYMMFFDLSDSLVCDILDVKPIEYSFDKDEQLIALADEIVSDISIYDGDDEAYVCFLLTELDDIMDNISDEYVSEFRENIIPIGFYDNKIIKRVRKSLKR